MWWSRSPFRALAVVLVVAVLGGCGFRPLYGKTGGDHQEVAGDLSSVAIAPIPDRLGQELRNHLLDLLTPTGGPTDPIFTLRVRVKERIDDLAIDNQGLATRANLRLEATYTLVKDETGESVLNGKGLAVSSYNLVSNDYSNLTAENDARSRAALHIARQIRARLGAHFAGSQAAAAPNAG